MKLSVRACTVGLVCAAQIGAIFDLRAATLPEAGPEQVGMSSQRLDQMTAVFKKAVDAGDSAGNLRAERLAVTSAR